MRVVLSFCANFALRKKVSIAIVYFGMSRASTVTGTYRFVFFIRIDGTDKRTTAKEKVAPKTGDSMILIVSGLALVGDSRRNGSCMEKRKRIIRKARHLTNRRLVEKSTSRLFLFLTTGA